MIASRVCSSKTSRPDGAMKRRTPDASGPRRPISFKHACTASSGMRRVPKKPAIPHMPQDSYEWWPSADHDAFEVKQVIADAIGALLRTRRADDTLPFQMPDDSLRIAVRQPFRVGVVVDRLDVPPQDLAAQPDLMLQF